jgi:hypothetical protein
LPVLRDICLPMVLGRRFWSVPRMRRRVRGGTSRPRRRGNRHTRCRYCRAGASGNDSPPMGSARSVGYRGPRRGDRPAHPLTWSAAPLDRGLRERVLSDRRHRECKPGRLCRGLTIREPERDRAGIRIISPSDIDHHSGYRRARSGAGFDADNSDARSDTDPGPNTEADSCPNPSSGGDARPDSDPGSPVQDRAGRRGADRIGRPIGMGGGWFHGLIQPAQRSRQHGR